MDTVLLGMALAFIYAMGATMGYGLHKARAHKQMAHFFNALTDYIDKTNTMPTGEQVANYVQFWIKP